VKFSARNINQAHINSPSNTILVEVCPCHTDYYVDLAAMLETHLPQVDALLQDGVRVGSVRRPVRLLVESDCAAQGVVLDIEGASATQPCFACKNTRCPSHTQPLSDRAYGALQEIVVDRHLGKATYVSDRMAADIAAAAKGNPGTPEHHNSVERSALLTINPRQIVPI